MGWEGIVAVATCAGLVITIAGVVFAMGKLVARIEMLDSRACEDRDKNSEQHREFYETSRTVVGVQAELSGLATSIGEVKKDVREILARVSNGG